MSYAELNRRANQLAHHLIGLGVGPEARVAICLERGIEMVPAILAVMKAGAAWVPMDPEYPAARLQFMLADSAPVAMLISPHLTATLAPLPAGTTVVEVPRHDPSTPSSNGDGAAANPPRAVVSPRNAAYVIYTSGSTGQPKGVVVEHRGFSNMITAQVRGFGIEPESRVLQFASLGFDASCSEIFIALSCGAALHVNRGIDGLVDLLRRDRVTHATLPPAVLSSLPDQSGFESVAVLITAGESLGREIATRWSAGRRLINAYGPTEATVCATMSAYDAGDPRPPAIGRPIANTRVYILDRDGGPMPAGVLGELHIGGAGVARGYVNQPALTAERFVPDPYAATPGARMYRTGDLGRWRTDGAVEFAGRNDFQIKLRGYRIELDEIAAVLERHDEIRDAVVVVRDDERAGRRLVAYAVRQPQGEGREPDAFDFRRLREHLLASLPEYMVPADVVLLPELPLSPSGKVDRRGLPDPQTADVHMGARQSYVAPRNALEEILCGIWTEVLSWNDVELPERVQAEGVGLTDNFFALGGHSLLAMQVIARIRKSLGMQLPIRALFEQPTVSDIARVLREMGGATAVQAIPRRDRSQPIPLSYAQQRLWFVSQFEAGASAYNVRIAYRITGHLHLMALRLSLEHIVARHEVLRTRFVERKGSVMQAIDPDVTFEVQTEDLRSKADPEEELQRRMRAEVETSFDLARGPMLRAKVLQLGDHEHVLLVTVHHIASDGWSLGLLARELAVCYSAFIRDDKPELPALPFQYADFAAWQRERLDGGGMDAQLKYWETQMQGSSGLLDLHTDYPRPALKGWRGRVIPFTTPKETVDAIRLLCRKQDVTLFMVLLAATQSLLARYTGQTDINIGTPIASRALEDTEKLIGPFANTLVLRLNLQGDPTFTELLKRAREVALGAYAHQDVPFERIVRSLQPKRDLSRTMMFQVTLALQNAGSSIPALEGVQVNRVGRELSICNYDLSFEVYDRQDQIPFSIRYDLALFSEATIRDMGRQLIELLTAAAQEPQRRLSELAAIGII
jgi:amino acid adenylation domain-containing protein